MSGLVHALKLLVLVSMYILTFFMRRLNIWLDFDLFMLILMSMYTAIFCGHGFKLIYVLLSIGFFARLVLEINLAGMMEQVWSLFVLLMTVVYWGTLMTDRKDGGE